MYQIGIDEAGYGPNLGPLVIGGTFWEVPDVSVNLYDVLHQSVSDHSRATEQISILDSKELYQSSDGLAPLEDNLFPLLFPQALTPEQRWKALLKALPEITFPSEAEWESQPSLFSSDEVLVVGAEAVEREFYVQGHSCGCEIGGARKNQAQLRELFQAECVAQRVRLGSVQGVCIVPADFNRLVESLGNKSTVLTVASLLLVQQFLQQIRVPGPVRIECDKHGGRNHYRNFLERVFQPTRIDVVVESDQESCYRWVADHGPVEIRFSTKGERHLPTALASMFAKYLREVVMEFWNAYWTSAVDGLKPTKGYPVDAVRFLQQIKPHLRARAISEESVWRCR